MVPTSRRATTARLPSQSTSREHPDRSGVRNRARSFRLRVLTIVGLLLLFVNALPVATIAAEEDKIITLGESLSPAQRTELLDLFDFSAGEDDDPLTVTTADTVAAMDGIFPASLISSAFSSTALTCRSLGDGLDVTTHNISLVTPGLYAMALVTAGIGDATLVVAAPAGLPNVQGMTALTGVFQTWEIAPCSSGDTTKERQRLALEELTLTVQIGQALAIPDGVQKATDIVLETQRTIVTQHLSGPNEIARAIAAQETAAGVTIPPDRRAQLIDLMTRLAAEDIDWSTFSAGWTIERPEASRIIMTGEGIAIRNARATATAEAEAALTATANAATATAEAQATRDAQQTATAAAALTATAQAQPTSTLIPSPTATATATATATPTPTPTATPTPQPAPTPASLRVSGTVTAAGSGRITIVEDHGAGVPVAYDVDTAAMIVRGGEPALLDAIDPGDGAVLTVDGLTRRVTDLVIDPAPVDSDDQPVEPALLGAAGLLGLLAVKRRRTEEPFVVKRKKA